MSKKLKEWQRQRLKDIQAYVDNGVYSFATFERERERILNPPEWFLKQMEA